MATAATEIKPDFRTPRRHFCLTDEHEALRESIESFCQKELAPHSEEWERDGFPDSVFKRMGELGFLGIHFPEEYGGQGGDYFMSIVRGEAMAHANNGGLAMGIAVHTDMATPPILKFGSEYLKQTYLVPAIKGEKISVARHLRARRRLGRGGHPHARGARRRRVRHQRLEDVHHERRARGLHRARHEDRPRRRLRRLLAVRGADTDTPGFHVSKKLEKLGMHSSDTAELTFEDVRVPAENLVGEEGKGFYHIMWELQGERLIGAAGSVAGAQRVFDKTLEYAKERNAFGRPIGRFQAIRHKFAEMATKIEAARQMVYTTAWRVQNGEYPVREISMAKLYASQIGFEVCDECVQIHGGYGYMKEYGVERAWRDMRLNRIGAGTDEIMLEVIGRSYGL